MKFNWELPDWPNFTYSLKGVERPLLEFAMETGEVSGMLKAMSITRTSKTTATRGLQQLLTWGVLTSAGAGRHIRYEIQL